jgi:hypothetical protein
MGIAMMNKLHNMSRDSGVSQQLLYNSSHDLSQLTLSTVLDAPLGTEKNTLKLVDGKVPS